MTVYETHTACAIVSYTVPRLGRFSHFVSEITPAIFYHSNSNKVFASGQAIREASLTVLRPTVHGSETSRTQKRSLCGLAASSGVLNPRENKVFAFGQAIRAASYAVLRPTVHGSFPSRAQKHSLCGLAASSGVSNPRDE